MNNKDFIVIGAGGHAKVCIDLIQACDCTVVGILDNNESLWGGNVLDIPVLGSDEVIATYNAADIALANGIGAIAKRGDTGLNARTNIYTNFVAKGYRFPALIHPSSTVSQHAKIHDGAQIMAGAIVQAGAIISENVIINTRASIDHDSTIGAHSHIAPGAILCGNVTVGKSTYIGAGATLFQNINVPESIVVAGGAVIRTNADLS